MKVQVHVERYGFWLDLKNNNESPVRVLWPAARYLDEAGTAHAVYAQPMDPLPAPDEMRKGTAPTQLGTGERLDYVVAPIYKASVIQYDFYERGPFHAPLIPTDLMNLQRFPDEAAIEGYMENLAERQVPVRLLLPIEVDGTRYEYALTFIVRDEESGVSDELPARSSSAPPVRMRQK
ncbi:MAG: hypothetical protein ACRD2J_14750 [Thermoanaerobaculia bacterium]